MTKCDLCENDFDEAELKAVGMGQVCAGCLEKEQQPAPANQRMRIDSSLPSAAPSAPLVDAIDRNTKAIAEIADSLHRIAEFYINKE